MSTVLTEQSDTWVNLHDMLAPLRGERAEIGCQRSAEIGRDRSRSVETRRRGAGVGVGAHGLAPLARLDSVRSAEVSRDQPRLGWRHLYVHSADGACLRALTSGWSGGGGAALPPHISPRLPISPCRRVVCGGAALGRRGARARLLHGHLPTSPHISPYLPVGARARLLHGQPARRA